MHEPDPSTPIEETLGALNELVAGGQGALHRLLELLGASRSRRPTRVARERELTRFVSAQNHYSLVERGVEDEILPACERLGIGMLPYFPLASGLLTGKYTRGERGDGGTARRPGDPGRAAGTALEALQRFADERGVPLLDVAIGGLAAQPAVSSVIAGATKPEQVRANVAAGRGSPPTRTSAR